MSRKQRFAAIVELVNNKGEISVDELAATFFCSVETIRRDLRYLESQGRITRTFGKAASVRVADIGRSFEKRLDEHIAFKEIMAEKAKRLISPGLTIALDSSTSSWYLSQILPDFHFRVVTNSMLLLKELKGKSNITLIGTGGMIDEKHGDFVASPASSSLLSGDLKIDLFFMSCIGADLATGLYDMNEGVAFLKKEIMCRAVRNVLLADSSKFGKRTPFFICNWSRVDYVVDDGNLGNDLLVRLHANGINII